ncbi:MAG: hypothetical protein ATN31_01795 [Candidatus Epulonipiscioides saccharophilum]|nr:MAG: hypothetical protein ATN31_01795 [Epulopiscium sp. AS2M-Bin001]
MTNKKNSKLINYQNIFFGLMTVCIIYFITVFIDFFLIFSNAISVTLFFLAIGALCLYFFIKRDVCLIFSFIFSSLCIAVTYCLAR